MFPTGRGRYGQGVTSPAGVIRQYLVPAMHPLPHRAGSSPIRAATRTNCGAQVGRTESPGSRACARMRPIAASWASDGIPARSSPRPVGTRKKNW